jgi:hypothetical protein
VGCQTFAGTIAADGIEFKRVLDLHHQDAAEPMPVLRIAPATRDCSPLPGIWRIFAVTIDYDDLARAAQLDVRRLRRRYA